MTAKAELGGERKDYPLSNCQLQSSAPNRDWKRRIVESALRPAAASDVITAAGVYCVSHRARRAFHRVHSRWAPPPRAQAGADPATAQRMANGAVENMIRQQAAIMSFNDVFWLLAIVFLAMLPFILLMRPPRKKGAAMMH